MTVRHAEAADRFRVIRLLREFHAEAQPGFPFRGAYAAALFDRHLADPASCCLVLGDGDGLLMATAFDHPFGAGRMAKESIWFIRPAARGRSAMAMLDAYEAWARGQGCVTVGMASLSGHDVSKLYERRGYRPVETHFTKVL